MTENKNGETSSADEILNDLATQMGVDESTEAEGAGESGSESDAAGASETAAASAPAAEEAKVEAPKAAAKAEPKKAESKKADAPKDDKKSDSKKTEARKEPAKAPSAADQNKSGIAKIFTGTGKESDHGDPHKHIYFSEEEDEGVKLGESSIKAFFIGLGIATAIATAGLLVLDSDQRMDVVKLLKGTNIIEERELRAQAQKEAEDKARLEAMPKYGNIEIISDPGNMLVTSTTKDSKGNPIETLIFPGSRQDVTYPTRTKVGFQDISVSETFTFTIHGEGNFVDKVVNIPAFGQPGTPWLQDFSGQYKATLTYMVCWPGVPAPVAPEFCLDPIPSRADELRWRRDWRPDPNAEIVNGVDPTRLLGSITVNSNPPGAELAFNGQKLTDAAGQPLLTPVTFNTYPPAPAATDRTPLPVYLSREGLPLQIIPASEEKVSVIQGVYSHMFTCTPKPGAIPPAAVAAPVPGAPVDPAAPVMPNWFGYCDYSYSVTVDFRDVPPPVVEGSGAPTGAAPTAAGGRPAPTGAR